MEPFTIEVSIDEERKDIALIKISGELGVNTVPQLEKAVANQFSQNITKIILDLQDLVYASSAGIGVIIFSIQKAKALKGDIKLANAHKNIRHLLEILGFSKLFSLYDSIQEARSAFI